MRGVSSAVVVVAFLTHSVNASVADPHANADVGVVSLRVDDPFAVRLGVELEQLGFVVAREPVLAATRGEGILVRVADGELELYEVLGDAGLVPRQPGIAKSDPLKAAEDFRARLLPLVQKRRAEGASAVATAGSGPPANPRAVVPRPEPGAAREASLVEISLAGGASLGLPRSGFAMSLEVALTPRAWRVGPFAFGIGLTGIGDVVPGGVGASEGDSDTRAFHVGGDIVSRVALNERFRLGLSLGMMATHLRASGTAVPPFTSQEDAVWTWSPAANGRLFYRLGRKATVGAGLSLFLDLRAGLAVPGVAIRFNGVTVGEWGRPWANLGMGIALSL
jgi:hypothetical protein